MSTQAATPILDLRSMPKPQRHPAIFGTYRSLEPGASMLIINDHSPTPLLYQFQFEHAGEYEWFPWQEGPVDWIVQIARRAGKAQRTVTEFLAVDHDRLDHELLESRRAAAEGRWQEAEHRLAVFKHGLTRHIRMEDELLFPKFGEITGMVKSGPLVVMAGEHEQIVQLLEELVSAMRTQKVERYDTVVQALIGILTPHNQKEENVLYPTVDEALSLAESDKLALAMQAI